MNGWMDALGAWLAEHKQDALGVGLVVVLALGLMSLPLHQAIVGTHGNTDYQGHIKIAEAMETNGEITSPHFLFQTLLLLARRLVPGLTFQNSAFLVVLLFYALLAGAVYAFVRPSFVSLRARYAVPCAVLISLAIMIITPITLLTWSSNSHYFGYIGMTVYHNPTNCLLKPLALLLFVSVGRSIAGQGGRQTLLVAIYVAALTFLSTMAKPSYTICILPVAAVCMVVRFVRRRQVLWPLAVLGLIGGLALAYQYVVRFTSLAASSDQMSVGFAPFAILSHYSSLLFPKFLLSILFPLSVLAVYWKAAVRDVYTKLAWLVFAVGAFYIYFLAELKPSGEIDFSGNFGWSGQVTLFVLFVASVRLFIVCAWDHRLDCARRGRKARLILVGGILFLHVMSSVVFYCASLGIGRQW